MVELDGGQHSERLEHDERRTAYLATLGLRVVRFWNHEVATNLNGVCLTILHACGGERGSQRQPAAPPRKLRRLRHPSP